MKLQSPVDKLIVTSVGYTFSFIANEPLEIPVIAVQSCLEQGCYAAKGEVLKTEEKEVAKVVQGDERERVISEAMRKMVASNKRGDFTGSGKPDATVLTKMLGFTVFAAERDTFWQTVSEKIGEEAVA